MAASSSPGALGGRLANASARSKCAFGKTRSPSPCSPPVRYTHGTSRTEAYVSRPEVAGRRQRQIVQRRQIALHFVPAFRRHHTVRSSASAARRRARRISRSSAPSNTAAEASRVALMAIRGRRPAPSPRPSIRAAGQTEAESQDPRWRARAARRRPKRRARRTPGRPLRRREPATGARLRQVAEEKHRLCQGKRSAPDDRLLVDLGFRAEKKIVEPTEGRRVRHPAVRPTSSSSIPNRLS